MQDRTDLLNTIFTELYEDTLLNDTYVELVDLTEQNQENQEVVNQAMSRLADGLYSRRMNSSDQEWHAFVSIALRHPLKTLLDQDPFTYRAFAKPRGYAGDAVLLDYVYGREEQWPVPEGTSPLGRMIFEYTTMAPASEGSRARRGFVADLLDRMVEEVTQPHVISIAAGHLREASLSAAVKRKKIGRFVALDSDTSSLDEVSRCYGCYAVEVVPASIRQLLTNRVVLGTFDLVYSTGLFDYLQQTTAQRLVQTMFQMLRPRGRLLIANVLPGIRDVGYMESYMDWKLIYRTRKEMVDVTMDIAQPDIRDIRVFAEENVNIIFLELTKR